MATGATRSGIAALAIVGVVAVGTAAALAARTEASPFALTLEGRRVAVPVSPNFPFGLTHEGTFASRLPFCESGTFSDVRIVDGGGFPTEGIRRLRCDDGSGTMDVAVAPLLQEHDPPFTATWNILDGTGSYEGLRGKGSIRGEPLTGSVGDPLSQTWRGTYRGLADRDNAAPTIAVSSVRLTKVRRPAGTYAVRLTLSLGDNDGNPVTYIARVTAGGLELGRKFGTTRTGTVTLAMRVRPQNARVRALRLDVVASDPVGNESSHRRVLSLPR
jgi:hypothetical protein